MVISFLSLYHLAKGNWLIVKIQN